MVSCHIIPSTAAHLVVHGLPLTLWLHSTAPALQGKTPSASEMPSAMAVRQGGILVMFQVCRLHIAKHFVVSGFQGSFWLLMLSAPVGVSQLQAWPKSAPIVPQAATMLRVRTVCSEIWPGGGHTWGQTWATAQNNLKTTGNIWKLETIFIIFQSIFWYLLWVWCKSTPLLRARSHNIALVPYCFLTNVQAKFGNHIP